MKQNDESKKIIITSISKIDKNVKYDYFDYGDLGIFKYTNEAAFAYLSKKLPNKDNIIIIAFVSREVSGDLIGDNNLPFNAQYKKDGEEKYLSSCPNTLEYYKKVLFDVDGFNIIDETKDNPTFITIPYDNDELNVQNSIEKLSKYLMPKSELYIDISGGLRSYSTVLLSLCDYFKYRNISIKEMISTYIKEKNGYIITTNIEEIMDLSKAVSRFTQDGNSHSLVDCLENESKTDKKIKNFTSALINYSTDIKLIRLDDFSQHYIDLKNALNDFDKNWLDNSSDSIKKTCLYYSISEIKTKLHMNDDTSNDFIDEPTTKLFEWSLENEHIIQALAVFEEKFPELFFKYRIAERDIADIFYNVYGSSPSTYRGKNEDQKEYYFHDKTKDMYSSLLKNAYKYLFSHRYDFNSCPLSSDINNICVFPDFDLLRKLDMKCHGFVDDFSKDLLFMVHCIQASNTKKLSDLDYINMYKNYISSNIRPMDIGEALNGKPLDKQLEYLTKKIIVKKCKNIDRILNIGPTDLHDDYLKIVDIRNETIHINVDSNSSLRNTMKLEDIKILLKSAFDKSINAFEYNRINNLGERDKRDLENSFIVWKNNIHG